MVKTDSSDVSRQMFLFLSTVGNFLTIFILRENSVIVKQGEKNKISKLDVHVFNLIFSDNRACVFPFNYWGVSHDRCSFHRADDMKNDEVLYEITGL